MPPGTNERPFPGMPDQAEGKGRFSFNGPSPYAGRPHRDAQPTPRLNPPPRPGPSSPRATHAAPLVLTQAVVQQAQFKTLNYRPDFPDRFGSVEHARQHARVFYTWYNTEHRHSGIGYHTPHHVHHGHAPAVRAARATVLTDAYLRHPERFVRKHPEPPELPAIVWINKPDEPDQAID